MAIEKGQMERSHHETREVRMRIARFGCSVDLTRSASVSRRVGFESSCIAHSETGSPKGDQRLDLCL